MMNHVLRHRWFLMAAFVVITSINVNRAAAQCPCVTEASGFGGGDGSFGNPYLVCNPDHLALVNTAPNGAFVQTADIDMAGVAFTPIGNDVTPFNGIYNGGGFGISNLTINLPAQDKVGLFGRTDSLSTISDLRLSNFNITGNDKVGGLIGENHGILDEISATVTVTGTRLTGGLVGENFGGISQSNSNMAALLSLWPSSTLASASV